MTDSQTETQRQFPKSHAIRARRMGIDTQYEAVVFMHKDCQVCRSEGFSAHARVLLRNGKHEIIATLYQITGDFIAHDEAALSDSAWQRLGLREGDRISIAHPSPLELAQPRAQPHLRP